MSLILNRNKKEKKSLILKGTKIPKQRNRNSYKGFKSMSPIIKEMTATTRYYYQLDF